MLCSYNSITGENQPGSNRSSKPMHEKSLVFRRIKKSANDTSKIKVQSNEKMKMKRPAQQNDITGIIVGNQWDENGNVIEVSVYTDREEVYIVAQTKQITELVNLIQTKVRVEGKVKKRLNGKKYVYVEAVRTLENNFEDLK